MKVSVKNLVQLENVFSRSETKWGKCSNDTRGKFMRIQCKTRRAKEDVEAAKKQFEKENMTDELKGFFEKVNTGMIKTGTADEARFYALYAPYSTKLNETLEPVLEAVENVDIPQITAAEAGEFCDSNPDTLVGDELWLLWSILVKEEEDPK